MGGQPKSEASSWSSAEVRRLWEEPTEAIPQNQREAAGILFLLGRGGCQHLPRHPPPALLVGTDPGNIVVAPRDTLAGKGIAGRIPPLWDGHAAKRIVDIVLMEVPRGHAS